MSDLEVNFDGLVGPTHNFAGLAYGNIASLKNRNSVSNPRLAALQGLAKMKRLMDLGVPQAVLPPQVRPDLRLLRQLGFAGTPPIILEKAWKSAPDLFAMCCSASSMWAANAATVAPSSDSEFGTLCITPANLVSQLHRHMESWFNYRVLRFLFANTHYFRVNQPLPGVSEFSDEGAANHMRLFLPAAKRGLHIFVYGMSSRVGDYQASRYPARQTLSASRAVARLNGLSQRQTIFVRQTPEAIDHGVFHNDVIAISHKNQLLCHEKAFLNQDVFLNQLDTDSGGEVEVIQTRSEQIPLALAVETYLYNSQLVHSAQGERVMLLPQQCHTNVQVREYVEQELKNQLTLDSIAYFDLQQSMKNGGGPACLRLRVPMNKAQLAAVQGRVMLDETLYEQLKAVISAGYPDRFQLKDLTDWGFCRHLNETVLTLYELMGLPSDLLDSQLMI